MTFKIKKNCIEMKNHPQSKKNINSLQHNLKNTWSLLF